MQGHLLLFLTVPYGDVLSLMNDIVLADLFYYERSHLMLVTVGEFHISCKMF